MAGVLKLLSLKVMLGSRPAFAFQLDRERSKVRELTVLVAHAVKVDYLLIRHAFSSNLVLRKCIPFEDKRASGKFGYTSEPSWGVGVLLKPKPEGKVRHATYQSRTFRRTAIFLRR